MVIEDSSAGVTAAKSEGMKCIGYKNPNSGNQDLSKADMIIDDFKDLLNDNYENTKVLYMRTIIVYHIVNICKKNVINCRINC